MYTPIHHPHLDNHWVFCIFLQGTVQGMLQLRILLFPGHDFWWHLRQVRTTFRLRSTSGTTLLHLKWLIDWSLKKIRLGYMCNIRNLIIWTYCWVSSVLGWTDPAMLDSEACKVSSVLLVLETLSPMAPLVWAGLWGGDSRFEGCEIASSTESDGGIDLVRSSSTTPRCWYVAA